MNSADPVLAQMSGAEHCEIGGIEVDTVRIGAAWVKGSTPLVFAGLLILSRSSAPIYERTHTWGFWPADESTFCMRMAATWT
jgi:hypothetical protein